METFLFIVFNIVTGFAILLFFLRFMVELAEMKTDNLYLHPIFVSTKLVDTLARIFKPLAGGRFCTSALVLMFLVRCIDIVGNLMLVNIGHNALHVLYVASSSLVLDFLNMGSWVIVAAAIASIIAMISGKMHPIVDILMQISNPIIAPFRKISPNIGMLDLSPMIAILALILMEIIVKTLVSSMLPILITDHEVLIATAHILGLMA